MHEHERDLAAHLFDSMVRHEVAAFEQPHIVVSREPRSGQVSHHGPFPNPFAALTAAADLETAAATGGDNARVVCRVVRLWAPLPVPDPIARHDGSEG